MDKGPSQNRGRGRGRGRGWGRGRGREATGYEYEYLIIKVPDDWNSEFVEKSFPGTTAHECGTLENGDSYVHISSETVDLRKMQTRMKSYPHLELRYGAAKRTVFIGDKQHKLSEYWTSAEALKAYVTEYFGTPVKCNYRRGNSYALVEFSTEASAIDCIARWTTAETGTICKWGRHDLTKGSTTASDLEDDSLDDEYTQEDPVLASDTSIFYFVQKANGAPRKMDVNSQTKISELKVSLAPTARTIWVLDDDNVTKFARIQMVDETIDSLGLAGFTLLFE